MLFDKDLTPNEVMLCRIKAIAAEFNGTVLKYTNHGNACLIGVFSVTIGDKVYPVGFEYNDYRNRNKIVFKDHFYFMKGSQEISINQYRDYNLRGISYATKSVETRSNKSIIKSIESKVLSNAYLDEYDSALKAFIEGTEYDQRKRQLKLEVCKLLDRDPAIYARENYPDAPISNKDLNVDVNVRTDTKMRVTIDVNSIGMLKVLLGLMQ